MTSQLIAPRLDPTENALAPGPAEAATSTTPHGRLASCILCGTDFSASASQAVDTAAAIAMRLHEPLHLVHSMAETFREQLPSHARDILIPEMAGRLHAEAERARSLGATVKEDVLLGWPNEGINERACGCQARLIVFGYPEFGTLNRWLRGSVAEVIAESSSVPTLVVHSAMPFEKWLREDRPLRILVAADASPSSVAALRWVAEWRRMAPCDITVGHIGHPKRGSEDDEALRRAVSRAVIDQVHHILGYDSDVRVVTGSAHVDEELIQLAGEGHADLLVVGTHQRQGLGRAWHRSISREILRHAPFSVACIPAPATSTVAGEAIP